MVREMALQKNIVINWIKGIILFDLIYITNWLSSLIHKDKVHIKLILIPKRLFFTSFWL